MDTTVFTSPSVGDLAGARVARTCDALQPSGSVSEFDSLYDAAVDRACASPRNAMEAYRQVCREEDARAVAADVHAQIDRQAGRSSGYGDYDEYVLCRCGGPSCDGSCDSVWHDTPDWTRSDDEEPMPPPTPPAPKEQDFYEFLPF